jgi:1,2-diacylglycerol 3-beta-galactosyltransferase
VSKMVMLFQAPLGGAHQSMAQAISEALSECDPTVKVSIVNAFSNECCRFPLTAMPGLYNTCVARFPLVWGSLYHITDGQIRYGRAERLAQPFIRPKLKKLLQATEPDIVVSVLPTLSHTLHAAIVASGRHIPLGVVVADLVTIHAAWLSREVTWYAVPTEEARRTFIRAGIHSQSVYHLGLPVSRDFREARAGKSCVRQALQLPAQDPVVLISGGGAGVGPVEATVAALSASGLGCYTVVMTGRNERLYQRLTRQRRSHCRILRQVTNVADWMRASDVLVTKAGPCTIMEALHCGVPMVLMGAIPGQEEGNVSFVVENGLGLMATQPSEVALSVGRLLSDHTLASTIVSAMQRMQRPHAAQQIAELIVSGC